jgi:hypothetical protein
MNCAGKARKLADYMVSLHEVNWDSQFANKLSYYHIGALFTDVVLQAGLNYTYVVKPRVRKVLLEYPDEYTVTKFRSLAQREGLEKIINWNHNVKIERFDRLLDFCLEREIDSCTDLRIYFNNPSSCEQFLSLKGFGPKSLDYLLKLLNIDSVAVDRHIYSFVRMAEIDSKGYQETKKIVEFAADFLNIPRSAADQIIWNYMSKKEYLGQPSRNQFSIEFT